MSASEFETLQIAESTKPSSSAASSSTSSSSSSINNVGESPLQSYIKEFQSLCAERAKTYALFDKALKVYQDDKDNVKYEASCGEITKKFQEISQGVNKVEACLREMEAPHCIWAKSLRSIQLYEREKLQLTVQMNLIRIQFTVMKQDEFNAEYSKLVTELRGRIGEVVEDINAVLEDIHAEFDFDA